MSFAVGVVLIMFSPGAASYMRSFELGVCFSPAACPNLWVITQGRYRVPGGIILLTTALAHGAPGTFLLMSNF